ncbi:MAG: PQQ-dependent sugar dehydrogenase [Burkholderiales bacterium]|nr:PQQ-dependent sugar dehydrogenase [Burkholderiales bacterium]
MKTARGSARALFISAFAASLVASCGGGGGDAGTPPPPPPPASTDTTPPTVTLTAPANLATGLSGMVSLTATGADDVGVMSIEFQVDGVTIATDTTPPYAASIDANAYAAGQHIVRARAHDAAGNTSPWGSATVQVAGTASVDASFTKNESWVSGLGSSTAFAQAPDGRIFVAEQGGKLRVVKNGSLLPAAFHIFTVDSAGERGLLGVAFHPNFTTNGYVYVYYTSTTGGAHNRISRLVASGDVSNGTEVILADLPALSASATNHNGGAIHFGTDGKLYAGVGDNANGAKAQDVNDPFGKMLRFNDDGSIPSDNPFCTTAATLKCAVWAYGLRNPFTFAVEAGTGRIHINDVGESTWEEIDVGGAGLNYGWPTSEGPDMTAGFAAPLFTYKHSEATPEGSGPGGFFTGFAIAGGAFYPASGQFPAAYRNNYFFADYGSKWIGRLDPANGNVAYAFANIAGNPVDMMVGADGALYVLTQGGSITRISAS